MHSTWCWSSEVWDGRPTQQREAWHASMGLRRYQTNEQHGAAGVMVIGTHRVMSLCVIVLLTGSFFGTQAVATDSRVIELANKAGVRILRDSSSDKQLQKTAAAQVPLGRMSRQSQQRALHLLKNTSQYRRMPSLQYEIDASLYQYLINHPDVAIATWRVMGISKLNMWQTAPFEYAAEANDGSKGQADVLWRDGNQCLFVVAGAYHSPLLPSAIEASALVWMRYRFERTRDNRIVVNQQIETFIHFPSPAIEAIAKLASMVTNSILDRNVMEVSLYAQMMSRAVNRDSDWVEEVADRMDGVPDHRKIELTRVARGLNPYESRMNSQVAARQSQRQMATRAQSVAAEESTLSTSKQQLLRAVRTGNVVVIVKPKADAVALLPAQKKDRNDTVIQSVSTGEPLRTSTALQSRPTESTLSTASKPKSMNEVISSAISFLAGEPVTSPESAAAISASRPANTVEAKTNSSQIRSVYSGHSKDGSSTAGTLSDFYTGPMAGAGNHPIFRKKEEKVVQGDIDDGMTELDSKDRTVVSEEPDGATPRQVATTDNNGDQPALIALPPVMTDE